MDLYIPTSFHKKYAINYIRIQKRMAKRADIMLLKNENWKYCTPERKFCVAFQGAKIFLLLADEIKSVTN